MVRLQNYKYRMETKNRENKIKLDLNATDNKTVWTGLSLDCHLQRFFEIDSV